MYLLESHRRGDSNKYQNVYFPKNSMGLSMKKTTRSADFCADRIDFISNLAVITNAVIKRAIIINAKREDICSVSFIPWFVCLYEPSRYMTSK